MEKRNLPSGRLETVHIRGQKEGSSGFDVRLHAIAWISELDERVGRRRKRVDAQHQGRGKRSEGEKTREK